MKSEESPCQPELEEKIEDKQIDQLSQANEVNKTDDKPNTSSLPDSVAGSTKSQPEDQPTIESVEQQAQEKPELKAVEKLPEGVPKMGDGFEPSVAADSAKSQPEDQPMIESVENQPPQEQPAAEKQPEKAPELGDVTKLVVADGTEIQPGEQQPPSEYVEKQPHEQAPVEIVENQPKIGDTSEPSVEAVVNAEQDEVLLVKESETAAVKYSGNSEVEPKREEEILEPVPKDEDKPQEQAEASKEVEKECVKIDPEESVKVEIGKEESLADQIEEQTTKEELVAKESSDQNTSTIVGAQVDKKDSGEEIPPAALTESASVDYKERELSGINVVEELSKEEAAESGDVELDSEGKNVETEEEKKVETEGSDEPEACKVVEDVISSTEKSLEGENTTRDNELVDENREESTKKDEIVSSVKTEENGEMEEKVEESQKYEAEVKLGETAVQASVTNLETEKEASEIAKPDAPKEEVSKKPTKQSNNIMAKVKQSLVKAKKAIIGKSPNSKPVSSEAKGDIKKK